MREILEKGAFSVRQTIKNYSNSAVDISLKQTFNRDAASRTKGIVVFRNLEDAMRRWSLTMAQRAAAVTELKAISGLEQGECQQYNVVRPESKNTTARWKHSVKRLTNFAILFPMKLPTQW